MRTFPLHVQSATQYEYIVDLTNFIGTDESGSFGIRAGHARMMTALDYGLARFQLKDNSWHYLAFPRGILYFVDNTLYVSTRRYLRDTDYQRISKGLLEQLLKEEEELRGIKESLFRLEQEMLRRLWQLGRGPR